MGLIKHISILARNNSTPVESGYNSPQTGDITFTDADFNASMASVSNTGYVSRNNAAYVDFRTSETSLTIKIGGNWINASFPEQSDCEVLVDGVYNQSVRLTTLDATEEIPITLPSGVKEVRLVNGYRANNATTGVFIQGVITTGTIEVKTPVTPSYKWLFFGDSITTGAIGTHPSVTGWVGLLRASQSKTVQSDSWGARRLLTIDTTSANTQAAELSLQMDGSSTNEIFICLGTNNFGISTGHTKEQFKTFYGLLLDAIRAIRTDIIVWCVSPTDRNNYTTANPAGATLVDYEDAIKELLTTRTWAKYIYGRYLVTLTNLPDGLHPNQTGMQEIHDNILVRYLAGGDSII